MDYSIAFIPALVQTKKTSLHESIVRGIFQGKFPVRGITQRSISIDPRPSLSLY